MKKLLTLLFTVLALTMMAQSKGTVTIECKDGEWIETADCDNCPSTSAKGFFANGLMIEKFGTSYYLQKPLRTAEYTKRSVFMVDYLGSSVTITLRETSYANMDALRTAIGDCLQTSGGGTGTGTDDWNNFTNVPAGFADNVDNVNDADADPTNELPTLTESAIDPVGAAQEGDRHRNTANETEWEYLNGAWVELYDKGSDVSPDVGNETEELANGLYTAPTANITEYVDPATGNVYNVIEYPDGTVTTVNQSTAAIAELPNIGALTPSWVEVSPKDDGILVDMATAGITVNACGFAMVSPDGVGGYVNGNSSSYADYPTLMLVQIAGTTKAKVHDSGSINCPGHGYTVGRDYYLDASGNFVDNGTDTLVYAFHVADANWLVFDVQEKYNLGGGGSGSDNITFQINGGNLELTDGAGTLSVPLSSLDAQDLTLAANILSLTNDGTTVDLSSYLDNTDSQGLDKLNLNGTVLEVSLDGDGVVDFTVDLASLLDNTDAQDLSISNDTLTITNGTTPIDLLPYLSPEYIPIGASTYDPTTDYTGNNDRLILFSAGFGLTVSGVGGGPYVLNPSETLEIYYTGFSWLAIGDQFPRNEIEFTTVTQTGGTDYDVTSFTGDTPYILIEKNDATAQNIINLNNASGSTVAMSNNNVYLVYTNGTEYFLVNEPTSVTVVSADANNDITAGGDDGAYYDDPDASATNEINTTFQVNGSNLEITDAGGTLQVALAAIQNNESEVIEVAQADGNFTLPGDYTGDAELLIFLKSDGGNLNVQGLSNAVTSRSLRPFHPVYVVKRSDGLWFAIEEFADYVSVDPSGNLTSTDVQAALEELQSDIDGISVTVVSGDANNDITAGTDSGAYYDDPDADATNEIEIGQYLHSGLSTYDIDTYAGSENYLSIVNANITDLTVTNVANGDIIIPVGGVGFFIKEIGTPIWRHDTSADNDATNEIQTLDTATVVSEVLRLSLSNDNVPFESIDLSSFMEIQDNTLNSGSFDITLIGGTKDIIAVHNTTAGDATMTNLVNGQSVVIPEYTSQWFKKLSATDYQVIDKPADANLTHAVTDRTTLASLTTDSDIAILPEGTFYKTATAADGALILAGTGTQWQRVIEGDEVKVSWWNMNGATDDVTFLAALQYAHDNNKTLVIDTNVGLANTFIITNTNGLNIKGDGVSTITYVGSGNPQELLEFDGNADVTLDNVILDGNNKVNRVLFIGSSATDMTGTLANVTITNSTFRNAYWAAANPTASTGLVLIQVASEKVLIDNSTFENAGRDAGVSVIGSAGTFGVSVTRNTDAYSKKFIFTNNTVSNITSLDADADARNVDMDGVVYFIPTSITEASVTKEPENYCLIQGNTFNNCYGRGAKIQSSNAVVDANYFYTTDKYIANAANAASFQYGNGTFTNNLIRLDAYNDGTDKSPLGAAAQFSIVSFFETNSTTQVDHVEISGNKVFTNIPVALFDELYAFALLEDNSFLDKSGINIVNNTVNAIVTDFVRINDNGEETHYSIKQNTIQEITRGLIRSVNNPNATVLDVEGNIHTAGFYGVTTIPYITDAGASNFVGEIRGYSNRGFTENTTGTGENISPSIQGYFPIIDVDDLNVNGTLDYINNQDAGTNLQITNTNSNFASSANIYMTSDVGVSRIRALSTAHPTFPSKTYIETPNANGAGLITNILGPRQYEIYHNGTKTFAIETDGEGTFANNFGMQGNLRVNNTGQATFPLEVYGDDIYHAHSSGNGSIVTPKRYGLTLSDAAGTTPLASFKAVNRRSNIFQMDIELSLMDNTNTLITPYIFSHEGLSLFTGTDPTAELDVAGDVVITGSLTIGTVVHSVGTGSPEGVLTGNSGDEYTDTNGTIGNIKYLKTTDGGNTGWIATN